MAPTHPTPASLLIQLVALQETVHTLEEQIGTLFAWQTHVIAIADERENRISELETYVQSNDERITGLVVSDEASGWKKWREDKERRGGS